jgi:hypothetical protein
MPHLVDDSSDFEKLTKALSTLTGHFGSVDGILEAFGLAHMPRAQRYGILFGFLVFSLTVCTVMVLLILGGSFRRIAEQAKSRAEGDVAADLPNVVAVRTRRPLLYERLLEASLRMWKENYRETTKTSEDLSNIGKMILNADVKMSCDVALLADESSAKRKEAEQHVPPGYQEAYIEAYRLCQDKPGGMLGCM